MDLMARLRELLDSLDEVDVKKVRVLVNAEGPDYADKVDEFRQVCLVHPVLSGAEIEVQQLDGQVRCRECRIIFISPGGATVCPACGSERVMGLEAVPVVAEVMLDD